MKVGIVTPTGDINPLTVDDQGGLDMLAQTGEYLCLSNQHLTLEPVLATKWTSNAEGRRVDVFDSTRCEVQHRRVAHRRRCRLHVQAADEQAQRLGGALRPSRACCRLLES